MLVLAVVAVVLLLPAIRGLRAPRAGNRWPFLASLVITSFLLLFAVGGVLLSSLVGRATWNAWTEGTPQREQLTLGVVLFGLPLLLVLAAVLLAVGGVRGWVLRRRDVRGAHWAA